MHELSSKQALEPAPSQSLSDPLFIVGILIGIIIPVVSAVLYPTYTFMMATPWVEWTRLLELPFVASEIAIIFWAIRNGMSMTERLSKSPVDLKFALLLLGVGCTISSAFISRRPADSLTISVFTLVHLLFFTSIMFFAKNRSFHQDLFLKITGIGLFVIALMTAIKFAFPPQPSHVLGGKIIWSSALPGFISVRHLGSWTGPICAAFTAILLTDGKRRQLSLTHVLYFFSAAMTIWSGTRAAIVAIAATAAISIVMNRKIPNFRDLSIMAMLTGAALTVAWLLLPYHDPIFRLFVTEDFSDANIVTGGRLELWAATYDRWLDSPLLGWGSGSTFWEVFVGWTHTQPHNAFLQFLISWGFVGASGALWMLGRAIFAAHKQTLRYPELQPMLAMLHTLLIMSLLEGMLHYPRFIMLIMFLFAIILSHRRRAGDVAGGN
jgi:exopolysaccharide production protein ExoQ